VTHRFSRLARRLGLRTRLHDLRHYAATQLIAGGVDLRTVSGRIGHAGGGATTLKVYTHFLAATDRQAAEVLEKTLRRPPEWLYELDTSTLRGCRSPPCENKHGHPLTSGDVAIMAATLASSVVAGRLLPPSCREFAACSTPADRVARQQARPFISTAARHRRRAARGREYSGQQLCQEFVGRVLILR
jgi:hypothetical protein